MGLTIDRRVHVYRKIILISVWSISVTTLLATPFSFATSVLSPSKPVVAETKITPDNIEGMLSKSTKNNAASTTHTLTSTSYSKDCSSGRTTHPGLQTATSPQLKKLYQYEQACSSAVVSSMSFFVATPTTSKEAEDYADYAISQIREFANFNIAPLVFFEPTTPTGLVDLDKYRAGAYDDALDKFFAKIKASGITDSMMGTWVPIPEGNIPVWTSVAPSIFTGCVKKAVIFQKKYFPNSKSAIMLDNETYPSADNWSGGHIASLAPYVKDIPKGLIDSFGLQGFPWVSPANQGGTSNGKPGNYLRSDLAIDAAKILNVKNIWFNTGTFGVKYANQPALQVAQSASHRQELLDETIAVARTTKSNGFNVAVHLFAEDKSKLAEATNWSYWPRGNTSPSPTIDIFKYFVHGLQASDIALWLYDS